jgi:hypothetical protein
MSASLVTLLKGDSTATGPKQVLLVLELTGCGNCVQTLAAVKEWKAKRGNEDVKVVVVNRTRFGKTLQELKTIPDSAAAVQLQNLIENATAFPVLLSIRDRVNVGQGARLVFRPHVGALGIDGLTNLVNSRHSNVFSVANLFGRRNLLNLGGVTRVPRSASRGRKSPLRSSPRRSPRLSSRGRRAGLRSRSASRRRSG